MDPKTLNQHFAALTGRLRQAEAQLAILSERAGVPYTPPDSDIPADIVMLAQTGKRLEAVKALRERLGMTFEEAKATVDGM